MKNSIFKIALLLILTVQVFAQQPNAGETLPEQNPQKAAQIAPQSTQVEKALTTPGKQRFLTYDVTGRFTLYFGHDVPEGSTAQMQPIITKGKNKNVQHFEKVTITRIEYTAATTGDAVTERDMLVSNLNWIFAERGLQIPKGGDYADAVFWGAFFLEMVLEMQGRPAQFGDITRIEGKDSKGNNIVFTWPNLQHYPIKPASNGNN